ncbi:MAG: hypothetical protein LBS20_12255 [Prevotella sp.]|jgi:hypothetical protein|nr:hypothetical protein [Prevotella sp.]
MRKIYILLISFIWLFLFGSCSEDDSIRTINKENDITSLLEYAKGNYQLNYGGICSYEDLFSNPQWDDYSIIYNHQDTLSVIFPLLNNQLNEDWYLIVNKTELKNEMFVMRIPEKRQDSISSNSRYFIVTGNGRSELFVNGFDTLQNFRVKKMETVPTKMTKGYWDCPEPEKYGNCIDGGELPEVIVYPGGNSVDDYWWWMVNMPNTTPPQHGGNSNPNQTSRPEYAKAANIAKDPTVKKAMENAWKNARADASPEKGRRERGFWIFYDKGTKKYYTGNEKTGNWVKGGIGTNGSVTPGSSQPSQNGSHIPKTATPISFFHTHTPLTYESPDVARAVGFSDRDIEYATTHEIEIILWDYKGTLEDDGKWYIRGGHDVNDPGDIYIYVP